MTPEERINHTYSLRSRLLLASYRAGGLTPGAYAIAQNQITKEAHDALREAGLPVPPTFYVRAS